MTAIRSTLQPQPAICCILVLLVALFSGPSVAQTKSAAGYEALAARARELAGENSWALARDAYTEALAHAPDAEARRWSELGLAEATWRADPDPGWQQKSEWLKRHAEKYESLGKAYAEGKPRDDFWMAWQESLVRLHEKYPRGDNDPLRLRAEIADYLGSRMPTEASAAAYVGYLRQALRFGVDLKSRDVQRFQPHLLRGMKVGVDAADRAWCAWYFARLRQMEQVPAAELEAHLQARAERWATAIAMARNTRWETAIVAEDFLWKANLGWSSGAEPGTPADIPALLTTAARLRSELAQGTEKRAAQPLIEQLKQLETNLGHPRLDVRMDPRFNPGAAVKFAYGTTGFGQLSARLNRLEAADWVRPIVSAAGPGSLGQQLKTWSVELPGAEQRTWHSSVVDLGSDLKPGFYSLTLRADQPVSGEPMVRTQNFIVSGVRGVAVMSDGGSGELFVYATADGKPVAGASATGLVAEGVGEKATLTAWQGTTDRDGRLVISLPKKNSRSLAGTVAGQPVCFSYYNTYYNNFQGDDGLLLVDAFVERPLYRPGETAHWKIVLRERKNGRFIVPEDAGKMRLKVELGDDILVPETPLQVNAFGTVHGTIAIPALARPGQVTLTLIEPGDTEENHPLFRVDNFVPPAVTARIGLASGTDSLRPGQEMVVRVTATYFSGGPVVDAPAECRFSVNSRNVIGHQSEQFSKWREELRKNLQQGRTDANGVAEFRMFLPADCSENASIECSAGVMPAGAPMVHDTASYVISAAGFMVDPTGWSKPRLVRPGDEVAFSARVRDGASQPAAFKGEVVLVEKKWSEAWLGPAAQVVDGTEYRRIFQEMAVKRKEEGFTVGNIPYEMSGWKRVHGEIKEIEVKEVAVESGADGRIAARFQVPHEGIYELRVQRSDMRLALDRIVGAGGDDYSDYFRYHSAGFTDTGDPGPSAFVIVAADEHTPELAAPPEAADLAWPENPDLQSRFSVLALVPEGTSQAWLTVGAEKSAVTTPVKLRGRLAYCVIDHPPAFHGTGQATLSYVSPGANYAQVASDTFAVRDESKRLHVTITPDEAVRRPGETAVVNLAVTDGQGRPRQAELAVAVADEAVVSLVDRDPFDETPVFLRDSRHRRVQSQGFGWDRSNVVSTIEDSRSGSRLNAYRGDLDNGEMLVLSPFSVDSADDHAYYAASTLAGTRLRTDLKDVGSSITVVSHQVLQDVASVNQPTVLLYSAATEVGGAPGNVAGDAPRAIVVRTHFSSSAFWAPEVVTDRDGRAKVSFKYPDNLTQWRIATYAAGKDVGQFGRATVLTRTSLPLQARLNLPRFLVAGDTAEVSATLVNRADEDLNALAEIKVGGPVEPLDATALKRPGIKVPRQAEARVVWAMAARKAGSAEFSLAAISGRDTDAMILPLPVLEDGIQQETAATGRLAPGADGMRLTLPLPATLDRERTHVTLQLSPSHATTMLDALPYLVDYPYGCVEQTMNRFMPAVIVRKTLTDLGLEPEAVERRILAKESTADAKRRTRTAGLGKLDEVVALSLARLQEAQSYHEGFGWWPGADSVDLWMTAYVSWGLDLAAQAGLEVPEELAENTFEALPKAILAQTQLDDRMAFALAALARVLEDTGNQATPEISGKFSDAYAGRDQLSASGRACLALACGMLGTAEQRDVLLRNLENGARRVKATDFGDTVHWGSTGNYWRAMDGAVETTAITLLALLKLEPKHPLVEPAVNWLVLNRRSSHWASTRDTAFAILALNEYFQQTKELDGDREIEVLANGTSLQRCKITRDSLLAGSLNMAVPPAALQPGDNRFELRRLKGDGPVYAVVLGSAWAVGDEVKPAASLISVGRGFERNQAQPTLFGTLRVTPCPLPSGGSSVVGEEVTARVTLTAPNELEYLMVEVPKPAGCEPLNPLSGWDAELVRVEEPAGGNHPSSTGRPVYREERDDRSVFFLDRVEAGTWEIRFGLRATTVGDFRALPAAATAMYVPEVRANSDAQRIVVKAAEREGGDATGGK